MDVVDKPIIEAVAFKESDAPEKKGVAYKVFRVRNGKLYPPMVANPGNEDTPIGVWLDAQEGEFAGLSKTGRPQVKSTGSGNLSYRPGWHLGDVPRAKQFDRVNKQTGEPEFPKDFVWAECEYAMDVDYQRDSDEQGYMRTKVDGQGNVTTYRSDKYQHSLAGLPRLPKNGYYRYRTNPNPDTVPWVITGKMKVNRLLSDEEVNDILKSKGIEPIHRQGGDKTLAELGLKESFQEDVDKDIEKVSTAFGTTKEPFMGPSYILPNGEFLKIREADTNITQTGSGDRGAIIHLDVQKWLNRQAGKDTRYVDDIELEERCIRVNTDFLEHYIVLPKKMPNERQMSSLREWIEFFYERTGRELVLVSYYGPAVTYGVGAVSDDILDDIRDYYARGMSFFEEMDDEGFCQAIDEYFDEMEDPRCDSPIFLTDEPYKVKRMLERGDKAYRIYYDKGTNMFLIQDAIGNQTHTHMINAAYKAGWIPEDAEFAKNLDTDLEGFMVFMPFGYGHELRYHTSLGTDDYYDCRVYPHGVMFVRHIAAYGNPLIQAMGKPERELHFDEYDERVELRKGESTYDLDLGMDLDGDPNAAIDIRVPGARESLEESIVHGDGFDVFFTNSPYEAKAKLLSSNKVMRVFIDATHYNYKDDLYLIGSGASCTHLGMIDAMWEEQYIDIECDYMLEDKHQMCLVYVPDDCRFGFHDEDAMEDGYDAVYAYDGFKVYSRYSDFEDFEFYKVLGEPKDVRKDLRDTYESLDERIVKKGSKWQVQSEKGRNLGTYDTKKEAEKRLKQVHYFKHMNEELQETDNEGNILSSEQIEFFKNSKVRDKQGRLLVCYHGTSYKFDTFDKSFGGKASKKDMATYGFFFGDITTASIHSFGSTKDWQEDGSFKISDRKPIIMPCYLNLVNPLIADTSDRYSEHELSLLKQAKEQGYDGLIYTYDGGAITYWVAFEPNQIKSIENKNPTNSDNINEFLLESKEDQQKFIDKFGQDMFDLFNKSKDRLKNAKISTDILYHVKNTSPEDMKGMLYNLRAKVDRTSSGNQETHDLTKIPGKYKFLGSGKGYDVYEPLDVEASMALGVGSGWCTTGRYGHAGDINFKPSRKDAEKHWDIYTRKGIRLFYFLQNGIGKYAIALYPRTFELNQFIDDSTFISKANFEIYNQEDKLDYSAIGSLPTNLVGDELVLDAPYVIDGLLLGEDGTKLIKAYEGIEDAVIPEGVTSIGEYAFYGCSSLASATMPESMTSIGNSAFQGCSALASVTIPDSVTSIGDRAFYECSSLPSIAIPKGVTSIENTTFGNCTSLASVIIPRSVTSIDGGAFHDCYSLTSINIPDSVTHIGNAAFSNCSYLSDITIPDGVTFIGFCAFQDCISLESIIIPDSVTTIDTYAFRGCINLTIITNNQYAIEYCEKNGIKHKGLDESIQGQSMQEDFDFSSIVLNDSDRDELIKRYKREYPNSNSFNGRSMFITPDGTYLDIGDAHCDSDWIIEEYFQERFGMDEFDAIDALYEVGGGHIAENLLGFVHVGNDHYNYLGIPNNEITKQQYDALNSYYEYHIGKGWGYTIEAYVSIDPYDDEPTTRRAEVWFDEEDGFVNRYGRKIDPNGLLRNFYRTGSFKMRESLRGCGKRISEAKEDWDRFRAWCNNDGLYDLFVKLKGRLPDEYRDIYSLMRSKTPEDLMAAIKDLESKPTRGERDSEAKEGAELLYDENGWKVYKINTLEASKKYGKGTKWCISGEAGHNAEDHWGTYEGKVYFYINGDDKYALVWKRGDKSWQAFNAKDEIIPFIPNAPRVKGLPNVSELPSILRQRVARAIRVKPDKVTGIQSADGNDALMAMFKDFGSHENYVVNANGRVYYVIGGIHGYEDITDELFPTFDSDW